MPAIVISPQDSENRLVIIAIGEFDKLRIKRENCRFGWSVVCENAPRNTCRAVDNREVLAWAAANFREHHGYEPGGRIVDPCLFPCAISATSGRAPKSKGTVASLLTKCSKPLLSAADDADDFRDTCQGTAKALNHDVVDQNIAVADDGRYVPTGTGVVE